MRVLCLALVCGALACGRSSGTKADASGRAGETGGVVGAAGSSDAADAANDGGAAGSGEGADADTPRDGRASELPGDVASDADLAEASDGSVDAGDASDGQADGPCHPILNQVGLDTGLERCDDGSQRRRAALECPTEEAADVSPCVGHGCTSDDQCTAKPGGYCADAHKLAHYCGCWYGCRNDSDCGAGSICQCGVILGQCVPATCVTNADCGAGLGCAANVPANVDMSCINGLAQPSRYSCQSPNDVCQANKDCPSVGDNQGACVLQGGNHRVCSTICFMKV
jgi:hypothetical protein